MTDLYRARFEILREFGIILGHPLQQGLCFGVGLRPREAARPIRLFAVIRW